jgi:hypothetical protein
MMDVALHITFQTSRAPEIHGAQGDAYQNELFEHKEALASSCQNFETLTGIGLGDVE